MAQVFQPSANSLFRIAIIAIGVVAATAGIGIMAWNRSPIVTLVGIPRPQPVPFSHQHHVKVLGLDCRYCHTSVDQGPFAGIPSVKTCMTCHSQIWTNAEMLEPIRRAYRENRSIEWIRVHDVPDYVYFDHSIHLNKGIGCVSCHGEVDEMPLMWKAKDLTMGWCLQCHRNPELNVRPKDKVYDLKWVSDRPQSELGPQLVKEHDIKKAQLTNCSICHR